MRKSKEETARTRERIVAAAAEQFRTHGIVGTGLADLMKAAGLTHGGFYKHFSSKDELVSEVAAVAVNATSAHIRKSAHTRPGKLGIAKGVATYLSRQHRDAPEKGCILAAIGAELARTDAKTRTEVTEGLLNLVEIFSSQAEGMQPDQAKKTALVAMATMVGAMTIARVVEDKQLSDTILKTAADSVVRSFE